MFVEIWEIAGKSQATKCPGFCVSTKIAGYYVFPLIAWWKNTVLFGTRVAVSMN